MKKILSVMAVCTLLSAFTACRQLNSLTDLLSGSKASAQGIASSSGPGEIQYSQPIPVDTANKMILSYLTSIEYETHPTAIRSWAFNADTLRRYLTEGNGTEIRTIKFMLAHTLSYIDSGHYGQRPSDLDNNHALTIVIVGVDSAGNYILNGESMPYDQCMPCPEDCVGSPDISD